MVVLGTKGFDMKEEKTETSVNEVLSSIKTAVLETKIKNDSAEKSNSSKKSDRDAKDLFVLTKKMRVKNSSNSSFSEKDFDKTSEVLLKKYAKVFATWQDFDESKI